MSLAVVSVLLFGGPVFYFNRSLVMSTITGDETSQESLMDCLVKQKVEVLGQTQVSCTTFFLEIRKYRTAVFLSSKVSTNLTFFSIFKNDFSAICAKSNCVFWAKKACEFTAKFWSIIQRKICKNLRG